MEELEQIPPEKRAYIDESGVNKYYIREYGHALKGVKIEDSKRGKKFHRTNVVAAKIGDKIVAPYCYTQTMTSALFIEWFRKDFIKSIPKGTTAIMDNASFHPKVKLKNLARRHGIKLLFLPPYSPDFNPIEKLWANMKRALPDILTPDCSLEQALYKFLL